MTGCLSVLMPTYNSAATLRQALERLLASPHVLEVLIADGGSTDETVSIINEYSSARIKLISKFDDGLYDGANKLFGHIYGEFVQFMNSDDVAEPRYVEAAIKVLATGGYDFVFGNIKYGGVIRRARYRYLSKRIGAIHQRMPFPHVSLIVRSEIFNRVGLFDTRFKVAADLDFINRLLIVTRQGAYIDDIAAYCAEGGLSSGNKQVWESLAVATKHGRHSVVAIALALAVASYRKMFCNHA